MGHSFLLGLNVFFILFVESVHLFFGLTECMTGLSFENPFGHLLLHFIVFLLEFLEFLILEIRFLDDEGFAFIELFDFERFLFGNGYVGEVVNFFFVDFKLVQELLFSDIFRKTFNEDGEIGGSGAFLVDFHFFDFFVVLENGKGDEPDDNHADTDPALNIIISIVLIRGIQLF
jgi:hypothetical protein